MIVLQTRGIGEILFPTDPLPETNRKRDGGYPFTVTVPKTLSFTVCSLATCSLYDQQLTRWAAGIWPGAWVLGQQVFIDGRSGGHVDV